MVVEFELLHYRTVAVGKPVQFSVQHFHPELVGQFLRLFEVGDPAEGVIQHPVFDVVFAHLARQNTVAIAVELQPEWTPRRHPQRAQPQILVDEVDVVVQAFAIVWLQVGLVILLVVPRLIAAAWLHGGKNANHARLFAAFRQDLLDPILLAETLLAPHELDLDAVVGRDTLHVLPKRLPQRLGPLGVVEDPDLVFVKIVGHPAGVAPARHCPLDDDPVVAAENPSDLVFVPFRQQFDAHGGIVTDFPVWFRLRRVRKRHKVTKTVQDLKFTRTGLRRTVVRYVHWHYRCTDCDTPFSCRPADWPIYKEGNGILAFVIYQLIEQRVSVRSVASAMSLLFGLHSTRQMVSRL